VPQLSLLSPVLRYTRSLTRSHAAGSEFQKRVKREESGGAAAAGCEILHIWQRESGARRDYFPLLDWFKWLCKAHVCVSDDGWCNFPAC